MSPALSELSVVGQSGVSMDISCPAENARVRIEGAAGTGEGGFVFVCRVGDFRVQTCGLEFSPTGAVHFKQCDCCG